MADSNTAVKVSQIFKTAGNAFTRLAELTMQINTQVEAPPGAKWSEEEIEMLRNAVQMFGNDLNRISEIVKTRSLGQLKNAIKRKIYTEAGMPIAKKSQSRKRLSDSAVVETVPAETISFDDFTSDLDTSIPNKKQKLEANEALVDVENLDESNSSLKKINSFISTQPTPENRTVGGVSELCVSHPPPLPPFDLVSDPS